MARKARVEFEGAVYHVLDRGDRREAIFRDESDRERFLATLGEACARTGWRIHALVLMSNHYHLLIQTPHANLVAGMRFGLRRPPPPRRCLAKPRLKRRGRCVSTGGTG